MHHRLIGQYLMAERRVRPSDLDRALQIQSSRYAHDSQHRIGVILSQMGAVAPEDLALALMKQKRDRLQQKE